MHDPKILVIRAQSNDPGAFEELVYLYQNKVYGLSLHLTGNPDDAQDLAQEAFIRAYKALGKFRNEADFGTWIHRITVNVWLNLQRKNNGQRPVSLDEPYPSDKSGTFQREVPALDGDPLQALEEKEFRGLVRKTLQDLSEEHRAVLVLREIEGYSYEEVSRMLNCSLGTVKSRLSRAREAMRREMTKRSREAGVALPATGESR
ncbi:MAG: ECF RNA polymerase sigma-E factor [Firmicutes bacterium ADurb.Bin456]|nr:MAG: ECF RNA polymerase sigma-E factor [Firmicutes bacterium ADurb.Bin456]